MLVKKRVMIVGHSYLAKENQKQLEDLSSYVEIEVVSPNSFKGMIFSYDVAGRSYESKSWSIKFYRKIVPPFFPEAAYLFRSIGLGMRRFKPDIIHIEGDPFTPFFIF